MPFILSTKLDHAPNLCMDCGETCRRPKRFCNDSCRNAFGRGTTINLMGLAQVDEQRRRLGITLEAIEWRRNLSVSRAF
jgi:hypothetical protein